MEVKMDNIKLGEYKILDSRCWNCGDILNINTCKNIENRVGFPSGMHYREKRCRIFIFWHYTGRCPTCGAWVHLSTYFRIS
jgi:hypothetical protein